MTRQITILPPARKPTGFKTEDEIKQLVPSTWVHHSAYRHALAPRSGRGDDVTRITASQLSLANSVWEKLGRPARVTIFFDGRDVMVIGGGDSFQVKPGRYSATIRIDRIRYLSNLFQTGEYPSVATSNRFGYPHARLVGASLAGHAARCTSEEAVARQRELAKEQQWNPEDDR